MRPCALADDAILFVGIVVLAHAVYCVCVHLESWPVASRPGAPHRAARLVVRPTSLEQLAITEPEIQVDTFLVLGRALRPTALNSCPRVVPCTRRAPFLPERQQLALIAQRCALYKRSRRIFPSIQPHRPSNIPTIHTQQRRKPHTRRRRLHNPNQQP